MQAVEDSLMIPVVGRWVQIQVVRMVGDRVEGRLLRTVVAAGYYNAASPLKVKCVSINT